MSWIRWSNIQKDNKKTPIVYINLSLTKKFFFFYFCVWYFPFITYTHWGILLGGLLFFSRFSIWNLFLFFFFSLYVNADMYICMFSFRIVRRFEIEGTCIWLPASLSLISNVHLLISEGKRATDCTNSRFLISNQWFCK